jgi:hypothetical protein
LLFHMLLGYLILRALTILVRVFGRLPDGASRAYATLLNKATKTVRRGELLVRPQALQAERFRLVGARPRWSRQRPHTVDPRRFAKLAIPRSARSTARVLTPSVVAVLRVGYPVRLD